MYLALEMSGHMHLKKALILCSKESTNLSIIFKLDSE